MVAGASFRLIGAFSKYQQQRNLRPRTIEARRSALRSFVAFYNGDVLSANWKDVEAWLDSRPLKPASRADYISYLHCFYVWAVREELTEHDPTLRIPVPRTQRRLPRPISEEHLSKAFANADVRMLAILAFAAYAGLRCMEIANLCVDDLLWMVPPLIIVSDGKGGRDRVVPLGPRVELALRAYGLPNKGPAFPTQRGGHYSPHTISKMINDHLRDCGLEETAHQLRHRFGSQFYARSKDIRLTQEMMGHRSVQTTQAYVAFSPAEAARYIGEI